MGRQRKEKKVRIFFEFEYKDESSFSFYGEFEGTESHIAAEICMVTRGTLMASMAVKATAYNEDGFEVCQYIK